MVRAFVFVQLAHGAEVRQRTDVFLAQVLFSFSIEAPKHIDNIIEQFLLFLESRTFAFSGLGSIFVHLVIRPKEIDLVLIVVLMVLR